MKSSEVRDLTEDQLKDELLRLKKEQFNLRFQMANNQIEDTAQFRRVKRSIARVKTIANEKKKENS